MRYLIPLGILLAAFIILGTYATMTGEDENCYPPVDSGQPETPREHGLLREACK